MRVTVLGGRGAFPGPREACSGYLLEHDGYRLLIDPGYGTFPRLQTYVRPDQVDAVLVSHGHPDHCADLNPLLRARALGEGEGEGDRRPLPVLGPAGALDPVLALDRMAAMSAVTEHVAVSDGQQTRLGPFTIDFARLPHHVPNLGMRITAPGAGVIAFTGDSGPDQAVVELGRHADAYIMEATYLDPITDEDRPYLCDVATALQQAAAAEVGKVVLTHLWPTIDYGELRTFSARGTVGPDTFVGVAGLQLDIGGAQSTGCG